ncbi:MAG TPA: hypothetical protein VEA79_11215 [Phenylobacterium sp.]|nr:hypothetical protein [Phenylobacterium sp.]
MTLDLGAIAMPVITALLGGGGVWAWLSSRQKSPAEMVSAAAAFQVALNSQADAFIGKLQTLVRDHERTIADLAQRVRDLEAENEECRGENRQLRQAIESLRRQLIAAGVKIEPDPPVERVAMVETNGLTLVAARRGRRRPSSTQ